MLRVAICDDEKNIQMRLVSGLLAADRVRQMDEKVGNYKEKFL